MKKETKPPQNHMTDLPITEPANDKFHRGDFASRVVRLIMNQSKTDSLVIGLYGSWGEGKTSIINLMAGQLKNENAIVIKFNPWRYQNENFLLEQFFNEIANAIKKNLKTKTEKAIKSLEKYAQLLTAIPGTSVLKETLEISNKLLETNIETLKSRVDKITQQCDQKIVIFIDDIDRLDKDEIYFILKLVKLNANFPNVTYVLALDEEMVSSAIADRFGGKGTDAGKNFLEKIVQVPLNIPLAQPHDIRQFLFEKIDFIINENKIVSQQTDTDYLVSAIENYILMRIKSPRLAIRYINSLSFKLPLLATEVNFTDLVLMEAICFFYPKHFQFIKQNPIYFIGEEIKNKFTQNKKYADQNEIITKIEDLDKSLTQIEKKSIFNLLVAIFPHLGENFNIATQDTLDHWYKNKRVFSKAFFYKYFSFTTTINGEISDKQFTHFIDLCSTKDMPKIIDQINKLVVEGTPWNFLNKIKQIAEELEPNAVRNLTKALSNSPDIYSDYDYPNGIMISAKMEVKYVIRSIIKSHKNKFDYFELVKDLINKPTPFEFAYDLHSVLIFTRELQHDLFNENQIKSLQELLLERAKQESGITPIFEKYPDHCINVLLAWARFNKNELDKYLLEIFEANPNKIVSLIKAFIPIGYSTAVAGPFICDLTENNYNLLLKIIDKDLVISIILKAYNNTDIKKENPKFDVKENSHSDINIIRQFFYWVNKEQGQNQ